MTCEHAWSRLESWAAPERVLQAAAEKPLLVGRQKGIAQMQCGAGCGGKCPLH